METQKFLAFWGLKSLPWNEPVPLDRLFWQEHTKSLSVRLMLSMQKAGRIFVLTALPGHGKSTLARWLYHSIEGNEVALFSILQQQREGGWLLDKLSNYLGLSGADRRQTLEKLHETCVHNKVLTIIIDNAHHLTEPEAFDEILSLSQIQSIAACHMNFVLIGNPRLLQTLQHMNEVQHRIALSVEIPAFSRTELQNYLTQRMQELNISRRMLTPEALAVFAQQGVLTFAAADALLESCLFEAYLRGQKQIDADIATLAWEASRIRRAGEVSEATKASRASAPKRRANPASSSKTMTSSQGTAGDLNALYYKSTGTEDSEE